MSVQLVCNKQSVSCSLKKYALCSGLSSCNLQNTTVTMCATCSNILPQSVFCSKLCLSSYSVTITLCLSVCRSFAWKQNGNLSYLRQNHEMAAAASSSSHCNSCCSWCGCECHCLDVLPLDRLAALLVLAIQTFPSGGLERVPCVAIPTADCRQSTQTP